MDKRKDRKGRYQATLRRAVLDNRDAIYEALTQHDHNCMAGDFAGYLLAEAGWNWHEFVDMYQAGELDD
jgi:hypothetical protein